MTVASRHMEVNEKERDRERERRRESAQFYVTSLVQALDFNQLRYRDRRRGWNELDPYLWSLDGAAIKSGDECGFRTTSAAKWPAIPI